MILIAKPAAPAKLAEGTILTQGYCAAFAADPPVYESGSVGFDISTDIYGHATVKGVLRIAQHKKCCFCEGIFEANAAADVEHYRPKRYSQQAFKKPRVYPGYYWLAYSWDNLFYCCQICNRSHKKNLFPLRNPQARVRNHLGNIAVEQPLLVNPGGPDDPRSHIRFRKEVAVGVTDVGEATVGVVGLNRMPLLEERLELFQILSHLQKVVSLLGPSANAIERDLASQAQAVIARAILSQGKFSAMASDMILGTGLA